MDKNRIWLIGSVLLIVVTVVLGYTMGISPQLDESARANEARAGVEAQNQIYEIQLAQLKAQFENIDELQAELDDLRLEVPADARFPDLIAQWEASARAHAVTVAIISVSDPQLYVPIPVEAAPAPAAGEGSDTGQAPEAATDAETAPVGLAPLPAAVSGENFVAIPISLAVAGDYSAVLNFVESIQMGKRLFLVTTFSSTAAAPAAVPVVEDGQDGEDPPPAPSTLVSSTITGYVYVLLDNTEAQGAVTAP